MGHLLPRTNPNTLLVLPITKEKVSRSLRGTNPWWAPLSGPSRPAYNQPTFGLDTHRGVDALVSSSFSVLPGLYRVISVNFSKYCDKLILYLHLPERNRQNQVVTECNIFIYMYFSPTRPSGPSWSSSRDVRPSVSCPLFM